jgi:hypothetical protein
VPVDTLIEKIKALPAERIGEVEGLVEFLFMREQERALTRAATMASGPAVAEA